MRRYCHNLLPFLLVILIISAALFLQGCRPRYNFDHEPPYINARMNEVFPSYIKNTGRREYKLPLPKDYIGHEVTYLDGAIVMIVIKVPDEIEAERYFHDMVVPKFKRMPEHYTGREDSWTYVTGKEADGRQWIGWFNQIWVFQLNGLTEDDFDLVIRASRFVSRKE
jgi:hypothetical protein